MIVRVVNVQEKGLIEGRHPRKSGVMTVVEPVGSGDGSEAGLERLGSRGVDVEDQRE